MSAKSDAIQAKLDKIHHGWRERTKFNTQQNCRHCGSLLKHPGLTCRQLATRLAASVKDYDPSNPWAWPSKETYEP